MSKIDEKRLWIIEARDGACGANGICKGELVRCGECVHRDPEDHRCDCGGHEWLKGKVLPMPDDWFCADGERRTDGNET